MKRLFSTCVIVALVIFGIGDAIHDFVSTDGFHYFSEQPHRLLLVAAIATIGGLVAFGFSALSRRLQRRVKLVILGAGATFVMLAGGYFAIQLSTWPSRPDSAIPRHIPWILLLFIVAIDAVLSFEFYHVWRKHDHVA